MFKVVAVSDKVGTAIDRLCQGVAPYHQSIEYVVCDVHPKRPDQAQLERFEREAKTADVIDYQYFRTADMLREKYEWLKAKPSILTHNNPYSIRERDWNDYNIVVANNKTMHKELMKITESELEYIPLAQEPNLWTYNRVLPDENVVIMVANRIEAKKGILEVALACQDLDMKMILVGAISDRDYFTDIMQTQVVEFHEQVSDAKLLELYHRSTIHVCNSIDDFESGTMPILEAMFCGVPIITRNIGHVPDLYNSENMVINYMPSDDVEQLIRLISKLAYNKKQQNELREKAWDSVKSFNFERRAYSYMKLYRSLISDEIPVSVIVPVSDDVNAARECINAIDNQTYKNIEIIVIDDGENPMVELIDDVANYITKPLYYENTYNADYGLARARNVGICNATGEIIVFCDQRMIMQSDAVELFVHALRKGTWVFGDKNGKRNFIENFSAIYREDIVKIGMFNERVNLYGGMSQEVRERARLNKIETRLIEGAKAKPKGKSSNKHTKRNDIIKMKNLLWRLGL